MTQTKTDRQNAARKATATRHENRAADSLGAARHSLSSAVGHARKAADSVGEAVGHATKSVASRGRAVLPGG